MDHAPTFEPDAEVVDQEFRRFGVDPPEDVVETSSIVTITSLLAETERVAVVPTEVAEYYVRYGMLAILPLPLSQALEPFGWIVRRGRPLSGSAAVPGNSVRVTRRCHRVGARSPRSGEDRPGALPRAVRHLAIASAMVRAHSASDTAPASG